jgi:hypothetical protein
MTEPLRILMGSDFHFGVPSMDQESMADAFAETIFPLLADVDIFFINGDFFDTVLNFDNFGFDPVYDIILKLLGLCQKHGVILRVLQGTYSHDRNQLSRFSNFYKRGGFTFNFRFANSIQLEEITIKDRTIKVGYVPDDLPFKSSDEIVDALKDKMRELGWDTIDYACMHGLFDFTLPKIGSKNRIVYSGSQFPFVTKLIDVGHVHQHRIKDNVISNGSFDRMCFGDEDPKGLIRILDYPDHYTAQFIENKNAAVFDTLYFTKADTTVDISNRIDAHLSKIKSNRKISLRFIVENLEHSQAIYDWMKEYHPDVRRAIKKADEVDDTRSMVPSSLLFTQIEKHESPTPKTIASFIRAHIPEKYSITIEQIEAYLEPTPV